MSEGWHDDPLGRYAKRYHDGTTWTAYVSNESGVTEQDPMGAQASAPPPAGGMPAAPAVTEVPAQQGPGGFRALPGNPLLRFVARLIDGLLIGLPLSFVLSAMGLVEFNFDVGDDAADASFELPIAGLIIQVLVFAAYEIYMIGRYGRTVGKMATGLTVVRKADCELPDYGVATVRYVVGLVYAVPLIGWLLFIITVVLGFSDPLRQTIHDKAASTVVAKTASLSA